MPNIDVAKISKVHCATVPPLILDFNSGYYTWHFGYSRYLELALSCHFIRIATISVYKRIKCIFLQAKITTISECPL